MQPGGFRFFLLAVAVRLRVRQLLSWMTHSTISPFENSMACAIGAGKLMYHCWLSLRWMSWTLVGYPMTISLLFVV